MYLLISILIIFPAQQQISIASVNKSQWHLVYVSCRPCKKFIKRSR